MKGDVVEHVLKESTRARNDDRYLLVEVWQKYGLGLDERQVAMILGSKLPSPETVRRYRQKLQQQGKYPAYAPVAEARREKADSYRRQIPNLDAEQLPALFGGDGE